jgi:NADPH:quinone reductase-like Zn-dependent oxidoreductase
MEIKMKAVVANPLARGFVEIGDVDEPMADSNEAVVRMTALSINRGEIRRAEAAETRMQIGWDMVGVVETPARDGSGPNAGQRVVGFSRRMQGWAERVALPTRDLAVIPDSVSDQDAATLPVAGLTALYALERCERLLGSRVLVTGASGGVGHFACQLGRLMGASVTALVRRHDHDDIIRATGVDDIVLSADGEGLENIGSFRALIDGVGGPMLGKLISLLEESGRAILYGVSAGPEAPLAIRNLMFTGDGRIEGFYLYRETEFETATKGLDRLLKLLADGRLETLVSVSGNWETIGEVAEQLIERSYPGKAVLSV